MYRKLLVFASALLAVLVCATLASAQEVWPIYPGNPATRGSGDYLSWLKLLACWILFLLWVRSADWVSRDSHEYEKTTEMPGIIWNPVIVFSFFVGMLIAWSVPVFLIGILVLAVSYIVPFAIYVGMRNSRVNDDDKVFTPGHLARWFASLGSSKKRKSDVKGPQEMGPPVFFAPKGGANEQENQANLIAARQSGGYVPVKELVFDVVGKRADRAMLDYTREAVAVRYEVDGLWHNMDPKDRETGDALLLALKKMANLNPEDRRNRQAGEIGVKINDSKYTAKIVSQGTKTGERVILEIPPSEDPFKSLDDLGMREKMRDTLKAHLAAEQGLVLLSAMPSGGLTTTWTVALRATDRYLRDFVAIEDSAKRMPYVENIEVVTFEGSGGESPDQKLRAIILKEPDVLVLPDFCNGNTVNELCKHSQAESKLIVGSIRAKDAVEALVRVLMLKPDPNLFAQTVTCVLNQRLLRRLCETCREPYEPTPQMLQKLGLPQGRVTHLYREHQLTADQQSGKEPICENCSGTGFRGRIGLFELLEVNDALRQTLVQTPRVKELSQVARQSGFRNLQEEGILLLARGVTSLTELQRVLKQ